MSGDDDTSFDPRSWGNAPGASSPATDTGRQTAAEDTSFDPRTWGGGGTIVPPPAPPRAAATPPDKAAPPSVTGPAAPRPPAALAAGASLAILLAGAGLAYAMRSAPAAAPAAIVQAQTTAAEAANVPQAPVAHASRRTLVIAGVGDLGPTLSSSGVPAPQVRAAVGAAGFALGAAPGEIRLVLDLVGDTDTARLTRLAATREDGAGVTLVAKPDGSYTSQVLDAKLTTEVKVVRGEMDATSFYNAAVTAGVTDSLITPFAKAFSYDFNFATDVHAGDIFEAAFEQKVNASGEAVGPPSLIYVSLSTQAKSKSLYRFLAPGDTEPGWYDGNGRSTITALMRTPVDGARISSGFGMRFHPVLHFNKMHKGTDFAAPIGTPIYAAGNGVIQWAAMKGPNGNLTILQHDNGWQTYYLHQSMFMPGVTPGARVAQGQKIGEIGTTGRSTGPHLHFELHIDGQPSIRWGSTAAPARRWKAAAWPISTRSATASMPRARSRAEDRAERLDSPRLS